MSTCRELRDVIGTTKLQTVLEELLNKHAVAEVLEMLAVVAEDHLKVPGGKAVKREIVRAAENLDKACWRDP